MSERRDGHKASCLGMDITGTSGCDRYSSCMFTWMGWLDPSKNFFLNNTHSSAFPLDEPSSVFRKERVAQ